MLYVRYRYRYKRSLLSVLHVHFIHMSVCLLETYECRWNARLIYALRQIRIRTWMEPSVQTLSSFCLYFCPSPGSIWIQMRCSSSTGNCGGSVRHCHLHFKQDQQTQRRGAFWKNGGTFWEKTVWVGTVFRHIYDVTSPSRDRQLQQNSWEGRDQMGNECQLENSEGEVEVRVKPVCSLRGALYWMYCVTSIPT